VPPIRVAVLSRMPPERARLVLSQAPDDIEAALVESSLPTEEQIEGCRDAQAIVLATPTISLEVLRHCPGVRLLQSLSAGYEELDLKAIADLGIPFANNGGANAIAVAEQVIGLMLMLKRGILTHWTNTKRRKWREGIRDIPYGELTGKTVGIVGLGPIGRVVAKYLAGFDCNLLYHDVAAVGPETERELRVSRVPLHDLLRASDIVTLHTALTPETHHLMGDAEFAMMKPGAILINASRGAVVDEGALYRALTAGQLGGAGLDVLEEEPTPPDNPLLDLDNVVITPHMAGVTVEAMARAARFAFANVRRAVRGEPIESLVSAPPGRALDQS
jgi:glyoxylate reductase/D-3-phosphoglycerate dehydrogenase